MKTLAKYLEPILATFKDFHVAIQKYEKLPYIFLSRENKYIFTQGIENLKKKMPRSIC